MTILDWVACTKVPPVVIHAVFKVSVANDRARVVGAVDDVEGLGKGHSCDQKRGLFDKIEPFHVDCCFIEGCRTI